MAMQQNRPNRFGAAPAGPSPATLAAQAAAPAAQEPAVEPALAAVPGPTEAAPEPAVEKTAAPAKRSTAKKSARSVKSLDTEVIRKAVEWSKETEDDFQDGCDDWYGDRTRRERKRRLGRRPSDNKMITALVRLGLEAIEKDPKWNDRLEELLPVDGRHRNV